LAARLEPKDLIWISLASLYRREGRLAEADQGLKKALDLSPRPHHVLINFAFPLLLQRNPNGALATIEEAVRIAPPQAASNKQFQIDVLRSRAAALNSLGNGREAIAAEEKAVLLRPECPDIWIELAKLYELNGRTVEAEQARGKVASLERVEQ